MTERIEYDEFGLFHENAEEYGIVLDEPPVVHRRAVEVGPGRTMSALVWGNGPPRLVLLHGGAQNAHTWDTVALALRSPLVAIDLPGHGHSDPPVASDRPLVEDLFGDGQSGFPSDLTDDERGRIGALLKGTWAEPRPGGPPPETPEGRFAEFWRQRDAASGWRLETSPKG